MSVERTSDPDRVNRIMSDAFGAAMDFTKQVSDPANYALVGEHGVMLFAVSKPGVYALTMGIMEAGRGAWAKAFVEEALAFMFTGTDATRVWALVVKEKRHVIALAAHAKAIEIEHTATHSLASVSKTKWSAAHADTA